MLSRHQASGGQAFWSQTSTALVRYNPGSHAPCQVMPVREFRPVGQLGEEEGLGGWQGWEGGLRFRVGVWVSMHMLWHAHSASL